MTIGVNNLFEQVLECTDALIKGCNPNDGKEIDAEHIAKLLEQREVLISAMGKELAKEAQPEKYRSLFETYKQKENVVKFLLNNSLAALSQKLKDAQQSRSATSNYDAYNRLSTYGAFIDQQK